MKKQTIGVVIALVCFVLKSPAADWPAAKAPVIPQADGYVLIPDAAVRPVQEHVYKAIFEATKFPKDFHDLLPAVNNAGSELNALSVENVPGQNWKFVIVFHGPSINGILDDSHYKEQYGVSNPNLAVLAEMKNAGVALFVCGQNIASAKIDPATITPLVTIGSDALLVLMEYENAGYAYIGD
jgi:intracellular sulfur oxidation DsrE/DsrF family protein